jgi:predicted acylesterase/phospholipase RssA
MKKKFILVLSGGGAKGAFSVGALKSIYQNGMQVGSERVFPKTFDAIFGFSSGALNGVMTAQGKHERLFEIWKEIAGNPENLFTSPFATY